MKFIAGTCLWIPKVHTERLPIMCGIGKDRKEEEKNWAFSLKIAPKWSQKQNGNQ